MNYLREINEFYSWLETDETLTPASINLWHALMSINNKLGWKSPFTASESLLMEKTLLAGRTVRKARTELVEAKRLNFTKKPGGRAPNYELIPFNAEVDAEASAEVDAELCNNAKVDAEASAEVDAELCNNAEVDAEASAEVDATFNKHINNKNNKYIYSASDAHMHFEQFWKIYPRKKNKPRAETIFKQRLKNDGHERIFEGAKKYVAECEVLDREIGYIKYPDTFLRNSCYLEEFETSAPARANNSKKNQSKEILPDWFEKGPEIKTLSQAEQDEFKKEIEKMKNGEV
ncbi:hypothetical protein ACFFF1_08385 [Listeria seeligeri]|uniref:hypothetical protein n=1 Tax=Listeria seeligeri TaxID=1640 RepID=UPI0035E872AF